MLCECQWHIDAVRRPASVIRHVGQFGKIGVRIGQTG